MRQATIAKKLTEAGIINNYEILSCGEVEVLVNDDYDATNELCDKVASVLRWNGAYKTGYNSWIVQEKFTSMGDWNDKGSKWHY